MKWMRLVLLFTACIRADDLDMFDVLKSFLELGEFMIELNNGNYIPKKDKKLEEDAYVIIKSMLNALAVYKCVKNREKELDEDICHTVIVNFQSKVKEVLKNRLDIEIEITSLSS